MRLRSKPFLVLWAASILAVCWGSLQPGMDMPAKFWNADKLFHILAYIWLAGLPYAVFADSGTRLRAALVMFVLGLALEGGQELVPGRYASWPDLMANGLGVVTGILLGRIFSRNLGKAP